MLTAIDQNGRVYLREEEQANPLEFGGYHARLMPTLFKPITLVLQACRFRFLQVKCKKDC